LASLDAYIATASFDGIQIHQYAPARIATTLGQGQDVELSVETSYPRTGTVTVRVQRDASEPWTMQLRVPSWATGASVTVDGTKAAAEPGFVSIRRTFHKGDEIVLELPLQPRLTMPDRRIDAVRGTVAVERGPVVYALESIDLPEDWGDVSEVALDTSVPPQDQGDGVVVHLAHNVTAETPWPYTASDSGDTTESVPVALVPYHDWAERGPSSMRIWLPTL